MSSLLVQHGCNQDAQDRDGRSALHIAAAMGHVELLRLLLSSNADPAVADAQQNTALHYAALEAREGAIAELLSWPAVKPLLGYRNASELLPLHLSTAAGDSRCVERLLEASGDVIDVRVRDEGTAAHMACEKGHAEVPTALAAAPVWAAAALALSSSSATALAATATAAAHFPAVPTTAAATAAPATAAAEQDRHVGGSAAHTSCRGLRRRPTARDGLGAGPVRT